MGRPPADLDPYKDEIRKMIKEEGRKRQDVLDMLASKGLAIHERTLNNRLKEWDIHKHNKSDDTPELRARVKELFYETQRKEEVMVQILRDEGWNIESRKLCRIRHEMGLFRAISNKEKENIEEEDKKVMEVLQSEIDKGNFTSYTSDALYKTFRENAKIPVSRDRLYRLFKKQAPHLVNPKNKPPIWRGPRPPRKLLTVEELASKERRKMGPRKRKRIASDPADATTNQPSQDSESPQAEEIWPVDPVLPEEATPEATHQPQDPASAHGGTVWIRELGSSLEAAWLNLMTQTSTLPPSERESFRLQWIEGLTQATEPFLRTVGRRPYAAQDFRDMGTSAELARLGQGGGGYQVQAQGNSYAPATQSRNPTAYASSYGGRTSGPSAYVSGSDPYASDVYMGNAFAANGMFTR